MKLDYSEGDWVIRYRDTNNPNAPRGPILVKEIITPDPTKYWICYYHEHGECGNLGVRFVGEPDPESEIYNTPFGNVILSKFWSACAYKRWYPEETEALDKRAKELEPC